MCKSLFCACCSLVFFGESDRTEKDEERRRRIKSVQIGSVGLGRLGYEHAKNLATSIPGCTLHAICDVDVPRLQSVAEELCVPRTYTDFAAMVQCENGAMGFLFTNRTHAAGCNVETEIVGPRGTLRVAPVGARNLLQIVDEHGARQEYYPDFMSLWHNAFLAEMQAFTDHIRSGTRPMDLTVSDGTAVSEAAYRCKESFETGRMLPIR